MSTGVCSVCKHISNQAYFSDDPLFKIRATVVIRVYQDHMVPKVKVFLALWFVSALSDQFLSSVMSESTSKESGLSFLGSYWVARFTR